MKGLETTDFLERARIMIQPPLLAPTGNDLQETLFSSSRFSFWLSQNLEEKITSHPLWEQADPILLGSWARGELCPKSDIDVIFCGSEQIVTQLVKDLELQSFKLRYRVPQNLNDWTEGVQSFDILALLRARPWTPRAARLLFEQQQSIFKRAKNFQKKLLEDLVKDRKQRSIRFDSIANFLEPNLKYGPGGLRDIDQALQMYELFGSRIEKADYALRVLNFYKKYFLTIRQKLHLESYGDVLVGAAQFELAEWCGFSSQKEFMKSLQRGMARTHFYTEWIIATVTSSDKKLLGYKNRVFKNEKDLWSALKKDPNILNQKLVRDSLEDCFSKPENSKKALAERARILKEFVSPAVSDEIITAVFHSRMIDKLVPEIKRLVGWVQHDQYHRFPADTHIMQARRELRRVQKKPRLLGVLEFLHKKISAKDWEILGWTCLYHDLAKGLEGDHSKKGVALVERDLKSLGISDETIKEVSWMVLNHLEVSSAAFRRNPHSPDVWKNLKDLGISGARLYRLALFTVVDIRATNPEAWNDWKSRLLRDLVKNLESESAQAFYELDFIAKKMRLDFPTQWSQQIDPLLVSAFGARFLLKDLMKHKSSTKTAADVFLDHNGNYWIRFFDEDDRKGLLQEFVLKLYGLGLPIRHASIHTFDSLGVWDWFMITTQKDKETLRKQLFHAKSDKKPALDSITYQSIQWVEVNDSQWIISFKAVDQAGLLAHTVSALTDLGLNIRGANVHTWGRQVDDVFTLVPGKDPQEILEKLQTSLQLKNRDEGR